jgi:hypothetical protein
MADGPVPAQVNVQVHSLLHTNLNTVDVSAPPRSTRTCSGCVPA